MATPSGGHFIGSVSVTLSSGPETGVSTLSASTTLKARAIKTGMEASDVAAWTFDKVPKVATPVANPPGGTAFSAGQTVNFKEGWESSDTLTATYMAPRDVVSGDWVLPKFHGTVFLTIE